MAYERAQEDAWDRSYAVQFYTPEGDYLGRWGRYGTASGEFYGTAGIAIDRDGNVYVAEEDHNRIQVFDPDGNRLKVWHTDPERKWGELKGIALDSQGNIYVVEANRYVVTILNRDGVAIRQIREAASTAARGIGLGPGGGLALDQSDKLYLVDYRFGYLHVFDSEGLEAAQIDFKTSVPFPATGVAVDSAGNVLVADLSVGRILRYSAEDLSGGLPGLAFPLVDGLKSPIGLAVGQSGEIYVAECENAKIDVFDRDGNLVRRWDVTIPDSNSQVAPRWIATSPSGRVYVTTGPEGVCPW